MNPFFTRCLVFIIRIGNHHLIFDWFRLDYELFDMNWSAHNVFAWNPNDLIDAVLQGLFSEGHLISTRQKKIDSFNWRTTQEYKEGLLNKFSTCFFCYRYGKSEFTVCSFFVNNFETKNEIVSVSTLTIYDQIEMTTRRISSAVRDLT